MRLVVDASVMLKWFLRQNPQEQNVAEAEAVGVAIHEQGARLFAPPHWQMEVLAVMARLDPAQCDDALLLLDELRPEVLEDIPTLRRGVELAVKLKHHLFDTLYHAVALEAGATLVTADEHYFAKAHQLGAIQRLGDFDAG